ncbi:MAG: hypothetical protein IT559_04890 [Alphaproteobacteria bacterium]|nr:hypothetical protein [Alphaproteobacteria bacterium]
MVFEEDESAPITDQAAEMMKTFLKKHRKPPRDGQWKDKYKSRVMELLWKCQYTKTTVPVDLVVLIGCLFGERHSWSYAKFEAVTYLAQEYEPIQLGQDLPKGAKSALSKIIKKHGGELKTPRKLNDKAGNVKHDYRRTIDSWIEDPLFLHVWGLKHKKYQGRKAKYNSDELLDVAKQTVSHSNS